MKSAIASAIVAIVATGCAGSDSSYQKISLDEVFTLQHMTRAKVDDRFTVRFDSVAEDSRCPKGVQCVWEGNAGIMLEYTSPDHRPVGFRLNTSGRYNRDTVIQYYRISLVDVLPHAEADRRPSQNDYQIQLKVERP